MATPQLIIGVDESGKGDFFGPLVVAAVAATDDQAIGFAALGIQDGKKVSKNRILVIDEEIRANYPHHIVSIPPGEYNRRYKQIKNLNRLLAACHAEVIDELCKQTGALRAVSDQFGKVELVDDALSSRGCDIDLKQMHRGEVVPQVAAASIVARAAFIRSMKALSEEYAVDLPLGAAPQVDKAGRELVKIHGPDVLEQVAKLHFKNYGRVVNPGLFA